MDNETYLLMFQFGFFVLVVESALKAVFSTAMFNKVFSKTSMAGQYISKPLFGIIVSLILCWQAQFDILSRVTDTELTNIGIVLTGLAISRGSNGLADFLKRRKNLKDAISSVEVETIKNGDGNSNNNSKGIKSKKI